MRWLPCVATGFVAASLPIAIFSWPLTFDGTGWSVNGVDLIVNGIPTAAGWMQFAKDVSIFGGCGAMGGLTFWLVWRLGQPDNS